MPARELRSRERQGIGIYFRCPDWLRRAGARSSQENSQDVGVRGQGAPLPNLRERLDILSRAGCPRASCAAASGRASGFTSDALTGCGGQDARSNQENSQDVGFRGQGAPLPNLRESKYNLVAFLAGWVERSKTQRGQQGQATTTRLRFFPPWPKPAFGTGAGRWPRRVPNNPPPRARPAPRPGRCRPPAPGA